MNKHSGILVVDDDENDLQLTLSALARQDPAVDVVIVHDGVQALDYLYCRGEFKSRPPGNPEVVLLDMHMPRASGIEVLRQIKSDSVLRTIPVVIFSSSRRPADVFQSYQLGANAYVVKPVDYRQFMDTVHDIRSFWTQRNEPPPEDVRMGTFSSNAATA
jgi:CheY-like chemotaxis protein